MYGPVCLWTHTRHRMRVEVRGQPSGVNSLPPSCGSQGWNSGIQAWWQSPSHSAILLAHLCLSHTASPTQTFSVLSLSLILPLSHLKGLLCNNSEFCIAVCFLSTEYTYTCAVVPTTWLWASSLRDGLFFTAVASNI